MNLLMTFIQKAIGQGVAILFGATGEIVTEKSGNLNLGIPGIMYMGGIAGLMGAFFYENGNENPNGFIGLLIAFFAILTFFTLSTVTRCASATPSSVESISQMRTG